ncbi:MAG: hypothetical protein HKN88_02045, partial [Gammaproteobacteria bacterium]|nr:hypothetical protein [Gammaproteobacteria bacterium]
RQANLLQLISVMLLAHTLILFAGWFRLSFMLNTTAAFYAGVQPFLLGALYKSIAAAVIVYALRKHIWKSAVAN